MINNKNRGMIVTTAGTGINLALGILYTWSIFKGAIKQSIDTGGQGAFQWDPASLNDPYALCCLVFACMMQVAGKCQDVYGPRITAIIGGILVGLGFIWISQTTAYLSWVLGFGVLVGSGIAFGYSSATPAALKWFPPDKAGWIAGIVVSGFGLASVYIAPLSKYLLGIWGLQQAMLFFGIAFLVIVCCLATFLVNPPVGYKPPGFIDRRKESKDNQNLRKMFQDNELPPEKVIRTKKFWQLWTLYFIGAGAGLMVIGSVAGMAKSSLGDNAFLAVAILALGNAAGRIAAGSLSDRFGRKKTLGAVFTGQAIFMFLAIPITSSGSSSALLLVLLASAIGFNYGANLALFPTFAKDNWGMKNFGVNYGLLFTAWGFGGLIMSRASQTLKVNVGSYSASFIASGILLIIGTFIIWKMCEEKEEMRQKISIQQLSSVALVDTE